MKTAYEIFFETHAYPSGWREDCDHLLYHFLQSYFDVVPLLVALIEGRTHPELPDDWAYLFVAVLPRKDYVYFVERAEWRNIVWTRTRTWEGNPLLDETSVERACTRYMKIPTGELLNLCIAWEGFS